MSTRRAPTGVAQAPATAAPTSQRARAYQGFTQQILNGRVRPGQFVSQRELMTLLDMPLGAVREMIPRLEAAGLVKTVPQRGLQIAHVDLKLVRNAFQVRAMVEREAVRHFVATVSDAELAAIAASHEDILRRANADGAGRAGRADGALLDDAQAVDWGLHDRMVDALGNEILSEIYRVNSLRVRLIKLEQTVITPARVVPAMQEHLRFIGALQRRDAAAAERLLDAHLDSARSRVLSPAGAAPAPDTPDTPDPPPSSRRRSP
ncbi:MAG TPA: GntR family transcriptional regulator [Pseudorhodoferax sp.]|nr:GntR family transcriptional regulator [Pseudorhodoferax sp.]